MKIFIALLTLCCALFIGILIVQQEKSSKQITSLEQDVKVLKRKHDALFDTNTYLLKQLEDIKQY